MVVLRIGSNLPVWRGALRDSTSWTELRHSDSSLLRLARCSEPRGIHQQFGTHEAAAVGANSPGLGPGFTGCAGYSHTLLSFWQSEQVGSSRLLHDRESLSTSHA